MNVIKRLITGNHYGQNFYDCSFHWRSFLKEFMILLDVESGTNFKNIQNSWTSNRNYRIQCQIKIEGQTSNTFIARTSLSLSFILFKLALEKLVRTSDVWESPDQSYSGTSTRRWHCNLEPNGLPYGKSVLLKSNLKNMPPDNSWWK